MHAVIAAPAPEIESRILTAFTDQPGREMQLLDIAREAHLGCKLADLRRAADHLVEIGKLRLLKHGGCRFYVTA